jgi:hypothetical protein
LRESNDGPPVCELSAQSPRAVCEAAFRRSATASRSSSKGPEYTSRVIAALACPSMRWTALTFAPAVVDGGGEDHVQHPVGLAHGGAGAVRLEPAGGPTTPGDLRWRSPSACRAGRQQSSGPLDRQVLDQQQMHRDRRGVWAVTQQRARPRRVGGSGDRGAGAATGHQSVLDHPGGDIACRTAAVRSSRPSAHRRPAGSAQPAQRPGCTGAGVGIHVPIKHVPGGPLHTDNRCCNRQTTAPRAPAERGKRPARPLARAQAGHLCPQRIGAIAATALVVTLIERGSR